MTSVFLATFWPRYWSKVVDIFPNRIKHIVIPEITIGRIRRPEISHRRPEFSHNCLNWNLNPIIRCMDKYRRASLIKKYVFVSSDQNRIVSFVALNVTHYIIFSVHRALSSNQNVSILISSVNNCDTSNILPILKVLPVLYISWFFSHL